jgi:hypothetical protein
VLETEWFLFEGKVTTSTTGFDHTSGIKLVREPENIIPSALTRRRLSMPIFERSLLSFFFIYYQCMFFRLK